MIHAMTNHDDVTSLYLGIYEISEVSPGRHLVKIYRNFLFKYSSVMFLTQFILRCILRTSDDQKIHSNVENCTREMSKILSLSVQCWIGESGGMYHIRDVHLEKYCIFILLTFYQLTENFPLPLSQNWKFYHFPPHSGVTQIFLKRHFTRKIETVMEGDLVASHFSCLIPQSPGTLETERSYLPGTAIKYLCAL